MKNKYDIQFYSSPIGEILFGANEKGIAFCRFIEDNEKYNFEVLTDSYEYCLDTHNMYLKQLLNELQRYFKGELQEFHVPMDIEGTVFQTLVWKELLTIPYGKTTSYLQQTQRIGNPRAIRAVASANGRNKHAILVPCHRVIGTNGDLTGYAGGIWRKKWLLNHEQKISGAYVQQQLF